MIWLVIILAAVIVVGLVASAEIIFRLSKRVEELEALLAERQAAYDDIRPSVDAIDDIIEVLDLMSELEKRGWRKGKAE